MMAGRSKEGELSEEQKRQIVAEFNFRKGRMERHRQKDPDSSGNRTDAFNCIGCNSRLRWLNL